MIHRLGRPTRLVLVLVSTTCGSLLIRRPHRPGGSRGSALLDQMDLDSVAHQSNSVGDCPQTDLAEERESQSSRLLVGLAHDAVW